MSATQQFISSFDKPASIASGRSRAITLSSFKEFVGELDGLKPVHLVITALLAIALVLPVSSYLAARLLDSVGDNLSRARAISIFVNAESGRNVDTFTQTLSQYPQIEIAVLVDRPVTSAASNTQTTRLVEVMPVAQLTPEAFTELTELLGDLAGVELVSWNSETLERNLSASQRVRLFASIAYAAALTLLCTLLWLLINKSIRLSRKTIQVKQQLGASSNQIVQPLVLKGCVFGILSGLLAYAIAAAGTLLLSNVVDVTIFNIDLTFSLSQIFFLLIVVLISSFVISHITAKKELTM